MKIKTHYSISLLLIISVSFSSLSQTVEDSLSTAKQPTIKSSRFDGVIKTKAEISTEEGVIRFNVRNSRIGVRGEIGDYLSYRVQVELSNEGTFAPLDLYGILKPIKNLSFVFGQQHIPFDNLYIITPAEMMFANRAFVGKFFTPGSRDIGAVVRYKFHIAGFPMEGQTGIFNGGRINEPQWSENPSYACRLIAGKLDGFRSTAKIYKYNSEQRNLFLSGADFHYLNKSLCLQAELMNRYSKTTGLNLLGTYIQGSYTFGLSKTKMFHCITPAFRWDAMGYDVWNTNFDIKRITAGINFGLTSIYDSVLRIDYEHYMVNRNIDFPDFDNRDPHVADNKITVELVVKF